MGILNELLARVVSANENLGLIIKESLEPQAGEIMEQQRLQLLEGKASSGEDLRPYYSEDLKPSGYFKSGASAANYSRWKQSISYPYSVDRNPDAPNLYINGKFHSELMVDFGQEQITIKGETPYANNIIAKYGLSSFGLMAEKWNFIMRDRGVLGEIIENLRRRL